MAPFLELSCQNNLSDLQRAPKVFIITCACINQRSIPLDFRLPWRYVYYWAIDDMLSRHRIVSTRPEHVVILSPSVWEFPFQTTAGGALTWIPLTPHEMFTDSLGWKWTSTVVSRLVKAQCTVDRISVVGGSKYGNTLFVLGRGRWACFGKRHSTVLPPECGLL